MAELATRSLEDRSSNVRRNAIKLLGRLVATHPFSVLHGGQLSEKEWVQRLEKVIEEINSLAPPTGVVGLGDTTLNEQIAENSLFQDVTMHEANAAEADNVPPGPSNEDVATSEAINKLCWSCSYLHPKTKVKQLKLWISSLSWTPTKLNPRR
jgi:condensin complex subunit 1